MDLWLGPPFPALIRYAAMELSQSALELMLFSVEFFDRFTHVFSRKIQDFEFSCVVIA
jgi:hypothetical protein